MHAFFNSIKEFEIMILDGIQELSFPLLDKLMIFFTTIGDVGGIWITISVVMLFFKKTRKVGVMSLIALIIGTLLCDHSLKHIIGRQRPYTVDGFPILIDEPTSLSFPSGHTTSSFAAAGVMAYYFKKMRQPVLYFGIITLAVLVSFSRMYLYLHYPSDIVAGVLLGLFSSTMSILLYHVGKKYYHKILQKRNGDLYE